MTQDPEDALAQEAVEGRAPVAQPAGRAKTGYSVIWFNGRLTAVPDEWLGEDPIPPDAQHPGG